MIRTKPRLPTSSPVIHTISFAHDKYKNKRHDMSGAEPPSSAPDRVCLLGGAVVGVVVALGAFVLAILNGLLRVAGLKEGHSPIRLV